MCGIRSLYFLTSKVILKQFQLCNLIIEKLSTTLNKVRSFAKVHIYKFKAKSLRSVKVSTNSPYKHVSSPEQALQSSCELLREIMIFKVKEMHASSCKCMPAYGPAFKLMELMKAHVTEYKLMELHGSFCNCMLVFVTT